jgi:hypothetical protein
VAQALLVGHRHGSDAVEAVVDGIRSTFQGLGESDAQRAWTFDLLHRQRFFVARTAWPISFRSWPILPAVDQQLLDVCGAVPPAALAERRIQDAILREEFPVLAALPLDRNSFDRSPLQPRVRHVLTSHLKARALKRGLLRDLELQRDWAKLYYFRTFWVNAPGWTEVRRVAEPHRGRLQQILDRGPVDRYLPPPDRPVQTDDMIIDSSRAKLLLGLMIWAGTQG